MSIALQPRFANLETVRSRVKHHRHASTQETHVNWAVEVGDSGGGLSNLRRVARIDYGQVWNRAHQSEVFDPLMSASITGSQARQTGDDFDVRSTQRASDGDEIVSTASGKNAISGAKRYEPSPGQASRHT